MNDISQNKVVFFYNYVHSSEFFPVSCDDDPHNDSDVLKEKERLEVECFYVIFGNISVIRKSNSLQCISSRVIPVLIFDCNIASMFIHGFVARFGSDFFA